MKLEFMVTLYRPDDSYSYGTLRLPATWSEYQDAKERARIFDDKTPCNVELYQWSREYLRPHVEAADLNIDHRGLLELNLLAHRLDMIDETLQDSFEALVKKEGLKSHDPKVSIPLAKLINLTFAAADCLPAYGVTNDQALGQFLFENEMLSDDDYDMLDKAKTTIGGDEPPKELLSLIGRKRREQENAVYTKQGYFECPGEIPEVYKPGEMAYFDRTGAPVVLEISKGHFNDPDYDNSLTAKLDLPPIYKKLTKALETVDAASIEECGWRCIDCLIPAAKEWIDSTDDFDIVEDFAVFLNEMQRREPLKTQVKYKAVLEATECADLETAFRLGTELDGYNFYPEMTGTEDYGRAMMAAEHGQKVADEMSDYTNLKLYGEKMMKLSGAVNTPYGILCRVDGGHIQSEAPDENQGMGGMSLQ
jgi:hypothetical protein